MNDPLRYRLDLSAAVLADVRVLALRAVRKGKLDQFTAALREITARLQSDPVEWGDPLFNYSYLNWHMYQRGIGPLYVAYALDEVHKIVYVKLVSSISQRRLGVRPLTPSTTFRTVFGVDFSGAKLAGRNTWVAAVRPARRGPSRLVGLDRLEALAGTADRGPALELLVELVRGSDAGLWAFDFPFGLPIEVMAAGACWADQFGFLREWADDAYAAGMECVRRAKLLGGPLHIRRFSDTETRTPFDCYHYRIIYQTFHGMRDVLGPLRRNRQTAILPFQYGRLAAARRVVIESCPASVLKALGLPHQNYKQTERGPLSRKRVKTRHAILAGLESLVTIDPPHRRVIMRNGGGDALDAVIAAVGAWRAWRQTDHAAVARHPRYRHEGKVYV